MDQLSVMPLLHEWRPLRDAPSLKKREVYTLVYESMGNATRTSCDSASGSDTSELQNQGQSILRKACSRAISNNL
eukprot:5197471-Amphidinium_carterae.1